MLVHGFPWPACHFESGLDLIIVPIFCNNFTDPLISMLQTNCCWDRWQSWYDKKYEGIHKTSNGLPIIGQLWSFTFFATQTDIRVSSKAHEAKEPLAFHRVIALLRTDRNHGQKLVHPRLFALSHSRSVPSYDLWTFSKCPPFFSELKSLSLSIVHFSLPNSTLLCCHNLLVVTFPQVLFLKTGRARISLMRFTFLVNASRLPFFFPEF